MPKLPRDLLGKLKENLHEFGVRETVERSGLWTAQRLFRSTLHRHSRTSLADFAETAASMHFSAEDLVGTYLASKNGNVGLSQLKCEYEVLSTQLGARYGERKLAYPQCFAVERGSAFLLYAFVRALRPNVVLETGVANGHSSFFILNAMQASNHGHLHSIDRSAEVGALLEAVERERWSLHVLDTKNLKKSFLRILAGLPPLDLFLHDSDHTNAWQAFELDAALKRLIPGGILASDDCDGCHAFLDVCVRAGIQPVILVEMRKIFGLVFTQPPKKGSNHSNAHGDLTQRSCLARI